ncbi:class F sortase [Streptomyces sp. NBC_01498]|uniref:class F sortase n=1 Tax=Streptomyces sp. NBC_01498 TaxID=2975870 RepID=UPI002E7BD38E|nr:class F sortase [Streptomyces sp. NBC_01498]WTL25693.1 class F sortase [Streptomyces sp. NBC_01498]
MTRPLLPGRPPRSSRGGRPRRSRRAAAAATVVAGTALACVGVSALISTPGERVPGRTDIGAVPVHSGPDEAAGSTGDRTPAPPPARIRIPAIDLDQKLLGLRVQQDGRLGVPEDPARVGWWSDGPRPGDPGAVVVVGHVDSATGPGAFHGLSSLRPGDRITLRREDGKDVTFTVRALRQYAKDALPDSQVYATTGPPSLRLITCGGTYDRARGEYRDNLVVYATTGRAR